MGVFRSFANKFNIILNPSERRKFLLLAWVGLFGVFAELTGVALLLPFLTLAGNPSLIITDPILSKLFQVSGVNGEREFLVCSGLIVFLLLAFGNAYAAYYQWLIQVFQSSVNVSLTTRLLSVYLYRPLIFHLQEGSARPGSRVLAEVGLVTTGILVPLLRLNAKVGLGLAIIFGLVLLDPIVAVSALVVFGGIYATIYFHVRKKLRKFAIARNEAARLSYRYVIEAFSSFRDLKIFNCEQWAIDRVRVQAIRSATAAAYQAAVSETPRYVIESVAFGCVIFVTTYFVFLNNGIQGVLPKLGVFTVASYRLVSSLQQCFSSIAMIQASAPALNNLCRDLRGGSEEPILSERVSKISVGHKISLQDVSFAYGDGTLVFDGLSLDIEANTTVGFAGTTGTGKSTLANLLLGLLEPRSGRMTVDGVTIDSANVRAWQSSVGYVPQDIIIIDDTVVRNVAFGVKDSKVDLEAVRSACKRASIDVFIEHELPNQYETVLGERGARLSGGQRQRIGIARALYRNPSVLVFDEATSALDINTERIVMEAVRDLAGSMTMTVILIAHRLSTLEVCDKVVLLERGRIEAQGHYKDVIST